MIFLSFLGVFAGIILCYCFLYPKKQKKEQAIIKNRHTDHVLKSVDVASNMLNRQKLKVSVLADDMHLWDSAKVLYKWGDLACFIKENPFSIKFNQGTCPKCSTSLSMIELEEQEIFICKKCHTQFDINNNELTNINQTIENQNPLINLHIAEGDSLSTDLKNALANLNPRIISLLTALTELKCSISIHDSEYLKFRYNDKTFIVWLEEENILHYPNWACIKKADFTQDVISKIQASNQFSLSCTYWLHDEYVAVNQYYYLSSNIDIYKFACKPIESSVLKECIELLIGEADKTVQSFTQPITQKLTNYGVNLDAIEKLLHDTDCHDINRDEDGDINFKYNQNYMYIRILDSKHIRIFWHCQELQDLSEDENINNNEDTDILALFIQWSNVGYPYKYTYYKPSNAIHSVTTYLDFDLNFIINTTPEYINNELAEFVNFIDNTDFTDEDYFLPIQDYYLPVIYEVNNLTNKQ